MSKLEKFLGKPEKVVIGGEELELYPMTVNDLDILMKLGDSDITIRANAMKDLIRITLKKSVSDATEEEINNFGLKHFEELTTAIMKVNGLEIKK